MTPGDAIVELERLQRFIGELYMRDYERASLRNSKAECDLVMDRQDKSDTALALAIDALKRQP